MPVSQTSLKSDVYNYLCCYFFPTFNSKYVYSKFLSIINSNTNT